MIIGLLIFGAVYLCVAAGWHLRRWCEKRDPAIDALNSYDAFCKIRDAEFPGMIGKWGKP